MNNKITKKLRKLTKGSSKGVPKAHKGRVARNPAAGARGPAGAEFCGAPFCQFSEFFWGLLGGCWGLLGVVGGSLGLARPSPHPPAPTRAASGAQLLDFERKLPWECTTFVFFELFFDSDTKIRCF